ncbi:IDEAL domain-containing protein [Bacillus sp. 03113]|uniref:IDEAL domain-containing protein n=1 Tax=Bacillus sp. 03113 TaxID=2578211 RepID=UPI00114487BD|nr:IDEAL domain-containing protein [Bacillus sp. 03113]
MNEKSYSELMKNGVMKKKNGKESFVLDLYIDMVLSEVQLNAEKEKLTEMINQALDERNEEKFIHLSNHYSTLARRFGT